MNKTKKKNVEIYKMDGTKIEQEGKSEEVIKFWKNIYQKMGIKWQRHGMNQEQSMKHHLKMN